MVLCELQPSFTGGEVSPSLRARTDAAAYHTWLHTAQNMLVHPQGGISNRPGTQYMGSAKTSAPCRLIPFVLSTTESYVLELGEKYMRFYTAGGPVHAQGGSVLELETPYPTEALSAIRYAQYNQTLYLAHGQYPLMRLERTAPGRFTLQTAPLKGGPFQPQNTDETKQMRLLPQTETVESEGVAATLCFQPVTTYPDHMVWAYFNGQLFYASENFGLNVPAIVQAFNTAYGSQGVTAYDLGGIIQVVSPVATGGDWNGKTFVLEYRRSFTGAATYTMTQTLAGGENAGSQTVVQPGRYILESNDDYFTPSHVGAYFCVTHLVESQYQSGTLGLEDTSGVIASGSSWQVRTSGNWTGTLFVEASQDLGQTWKAVKTLTRASGDDNFYLTGNLNDPENLFQVRLRSDQVSGEVGYELSADSFFQRGIVTVLNYVSPTEVVTSCQQAFGSQAWSSAWAEGSFSPAAGYPACVGCFQDRLCLAATQREAQTLWFSKTGNLMDFGQARDTLLDTDALSVRLAGGQLNAVQALCVSNRLLIFTAGGEWSLSCNGSFTLDHLQLESQGSRGSYTTAPVQVGGEVLFVQARGGVLRQLQYDDTSCAYVSNDLTLRARHLFEGRTLEQMAFAQEPDSVLWCVMSDGELLSLTYLPQQHIYAWTHHQTQGKVISICAVAQEGYDSVWLCVQRNGQYLIERLAPRSTTEPLFVDAAVSYSFVTPQTQLTGISHLNGFSVNVLADGNVITKMSVSNGALTLPFAASRVQVGLAYTSRLRTLPIAAGVQPHRFVRVVASFLNSRGGKIGVSGGPLTPLVQRTHEGYNVPIALQTGRTRVTLCGRSDFESGVVIEQTDPLPFTVLALEIHAA